MARAVGIDLGTTNSVVAVLEGGEPTVIANAEGSRTTPSVVAFSKTGEVLVGEVAKRQAVTNVDRTISSVKRHMGTDWSSASTTRSTPRRRSPRASSASSSATPRTTWASPSPRPSSRSRRTSTTPSARPRRTPAQIAGLNVQRIVNEPTAAALAYGLEQGQGGRAHPGLRPGWRHVRRLPARGGQGRGRLLDHPGARHLR